MALAFSFAAVGVRLETKEGGGVGGGAGPPKTKKAAHVFLRRAAGASSSGDGAAGAAAQPPAAAAALPAVSDATLATFCLPLGADAARPKAIMAPDEFSFTLTLGDGSRLHGFCRRFLPPAAPPALRERASASAPAALRQGQQQQEESGGARFPVVLCVLCRSQWRALLFRALEAAEQLLALQPELLVASAPPVELPPRSHAGHFLAALEAALARGPALGETLRVALPVQLPGGLGASDGGAGGGSSVAAASGRGGNDKGAPFLELQAPPDSGNGADNAGVPLAALLWAVPPPALAALLAALLLERRVVVVAQSPGAVSAAVAAAGALIYPFK